MEKSKSLLPSVGFDRYIELEWVNYALDLAIAGGDSGEMKNWLSKRIQGKDAMRKTLNLLTNIWLREYPETRHLRDEGLALARLFSQNEYIVFHWGMALANFSFFAQTVAIIGRLIRIQGDFERIEVRKRVLESYSNQGTIPRSVDRIIQSLCNWEILGSKDKRSYQAQRKIPLMHDQQLNWLVKCIVNNDPQTGIAITDIGRDAKLFPFMFKMDVREVLYRSEDFEITRSGRNEEMLVLKTACK